MQNLTRNSSVTQFTSGKPPRVSIGMPVFNGETFLPQAISCLLAQTFTDFELIISDNASTDDTLAIVDHFVSQDDRVTCIKNHKNTGHFANFQKVLAVARGEFFMWAAHDDLWEPEFVEELLALLENSPDAGLAFCRFDDVDTTSRSVKQYDLRHLDSSNRNRTLCRFLMRPRGTGNLVMGLMRREVLQEAKGFHAWSGQWWGGDKLVAFRLLSIGGLKLSDRLLFHKRLPAKNRVERAAGIDSEMAFQRQQTQQYKLYWSTYHRMIRDFSDFNSLSKLQLRLVVCMCDFNQQLKTLREVFHTYRRAIRNKILGRDNSMQKMSLENDSQRVA